MSDPKKSKAKAIKTAASIPGKTSMSFRCSCGFSKTVSLLGFLMLFDVMYVCRGRISSNKRR